MNTDAAPCTLSHRAYWWDGDSHLGKVKVWSNAWLS